MSRPPASHSGFHPSSISGWHPTASGGLVPAARTVVPASGRPQRAVQRRCLTDAAHVWLARMPPRFQPLATARAHPHIVNRLAELWARPDELAVYFRDLLLSRREGRQGFSFDVLTELFDLQTQLPRRASH